MRFSYRFTALQVPAILLALGLTAFGAGCKGRGSATADNAEEAPTAVAEAVPPQLDEQGNPVYEEGAEPPPVSLSGEAHAPGPSSLGGSGAKLAALAWETSIYKAPSADSFVLGYLRAGGIVPSGAKPVGYDGCKGGWYAIAPFGFVCADQGNATTDLNHELVRALSRRPDTTTALPYMYGIVRRPGPIYGRLPTRAQAAAAEVGLEERMHEWFKLKDHNGASFRADYWVRWKADQNVPNATTLWETAANVDIPWYLEGGRLPPGNLSGAIKNKNDIVVAHMKRHNGFAFLDTMVHEGRRYAISSRLLAMPVDRLRPIEGSQMHGHEIPRDIDFPFALVRTAGAHAYAYKDRRLAKSKPIERWSAIKLTGKQQFFRRVLHFETVDGLWLSDREVSRLDPARRMPKWGTNGERWLDINVTKQTLVAYDGTKPVFATLVSTGEAGLGDPEKTKATKRGIFRIDRKHVAATMASDVVGEEFELQDIPYVQYFEGGYALHAAYWHSDFGTPRSHGCINLSPDDARRLFFWTEPKLPPGWHSVRRPLTGTILFVHP